MRSDRLILACVAPVKHVSIFGVRYSGRMQIQDNAYNLSRYFHGPWEDGMLFETSLPRKQNTYESKDRDTMITECYKMDHKHRGRAIIINNVNFDRKQSLRRREGSDLDRIKLKDVLEEMQFKVSIYRDLTADKMKEELKKAAADEDYNKNSDCFVCVISSHGKEGEVYGFDGPIELTSLFHPFNTTGKNGLHGKPKLFFIQACRGNRSDHGVTSENSNLEVDSVNVAENTANEDMHRIVIPTYSDFLIGYSAAPGYTSVRDKKSGSWFLQALSTALREHWRELDLLSIMTKVNQNVAEKCDGCDSGQGVKEIPCITSMLRKQVRFGPKPKL